MTTETLAVGLGMPRVRLTEPTPAERERYRSWLDRHAEDLAAGYVAAEDLARAYDRAAVVTSFDGKPDLPPYFQVEIDVHYSRWEATRWGGQKTYNVPYSRRL